MSTPGNELIAFVRARLDEDNTGRHLDFTSYRTLAAAWSDHPDYRAEWASDE
jgi:hypothetical protein